MSQTPRRMGWTALPLKCPDCGHKLLQKAVLLHGGVLRCGHCDALQYVVLVAHAHAAFMADITAAEVHEFYVASCSISQVLERLGAMRGAA